jgi:hypothetical protein
MAEPLTDQDDRALDLRGQGHSFAAIARELGLSSAPMAVEAFNRALRARPPEQQEELRRDENARLDALADHVRADDRLDDETKEKRLRVIERMRGALRAA